MASKRVIRIHQPLFGGFPMRWVVKKADDSIGFVDDSTKADTFTVDEFAKIEIELRAMAPNAVIAYGGI